MKILIFIISFFLLSLLNFDINSENKSLKLQIEKTEDGYDILSINGDLLLEFNKNNCDKESLQTLEYIYKTVKEKE